MTGSRICQRLKNDPNGDALTVSRAVRLRE